MTRILTVVCLLCAAPILLAHTSGTVKKTCPLCASNFEAEMDMSGSQFGVRLDLKPLGPIAVPWRVAVCPKCHFVLFKEDLNETEKNILGAYVRSEKYKKLVSDGHSSYFLLANTIGELNHALLDIAYAYLKASWQVESTSPKRYQIYLEESLRNLRSALKDEGAKGEDERKEASLLAGEILRQLSRFQEAKDHFERLASDPGFGKQPHRTIVRYELDLIRAADSRPAKRPPIVLTREDKMELPEYKMSYALNGISAVTNLFSVFEASIGHINMLPYSLLVMLDPSDKNRNVVNSAWWFNPVDERSQKAAHDWNDFIKCYGEVNDVVSKHDWIMDWRNAGSHRTVQACVFGVRPNTETMLEAMVLPGWKHANMKGIPEYEVNLRRAGQWCATIYFGKGENRAFVATIHGSDGKHWLDKQNLSYHPTQEIPNYIIVDQNGKWFRNGKGRQDSNKDMDSDKK
ncbi:MAG: DUF2225 domain-containing protein [Verrucomicrobia bacterium]|nr:DUF2225 domain-containing protein [Verrucomicrobiota bacterium]